MPYADLSGAPLHDEESVGSEVVGAEVSVEAPVTVAPTAETSVAVPEPSVADAVKEAVNESAPTNGWKLISSLAYFAITVFSLYLAYACNKKFDLVHIIVAFLCPVCYIPYGLYCMMKGRM